MSPNNNEDRALAGGINEYLRDRDAARNDRAPLPLPAAMTDAKSTPEQKAAAEELYTSSLLNRKSLTEAEQKWLGSRISECLRGMKG